MPEHLVERHRATGGAACGRERAVSLEQITHVRERSRGVCPGCYRGAVRRRDPDAAPVRRRCA
ncbi:hypothetical protein VO01_02260 [Clavibacter michiganensis subsp. insidiosus]|uniref:Uncharacterized protein n=1 Tax=Clavibacter michiganensis subsp. insidiosus TaxID=33014 RepID=A0A0D5CL40_9MICO|nr:hypothetical protein VO01_02260 [Clavibacter michiganensis subsp. insidiosus]